MKSSTMRQNVNSGACFSENAKQQLPALTASLYVGFLIIDSTRTVLGAERV
jgi:hypothetical protein